MKAVFYDLDGGQVPLVEKFAKKRGISLGYCGPRPFDGSTVSLAEDAEIVSVFMTSDMPRGLLEQMPRLTLIATRSTGFDHIDLDYAAEKGITVVNVRSYGEETVAEYSFALILMLARRLPLTHRQCLKGNFGQRNVMGNDLNGKTLGIIGTGRIGRNLVRMCAAGLQMKVLAYDSYPNDELVAQYGVKYVDLETLLKNSDVISLHMPYLPATHHLINGDNVKLMKKGVILVNTARGGIVSSSALLWGLKNGLFGGLGLDTFEGESVWINGEQIFSETLHPEADHYRNALLSFHLQQFPNVVLTPHNAFNSHEAALRILNTTLEDIVAFQEGHPVQNEVKKNG